MIDARLKAVGTTLAQVVVGLVPACIALAGIPAAGPINTTVKVAGAEVAISLYYAGTVGRVQLELKTPIHYNPAGDVLAVIEAALKESGLVATVRVRVQEECYRDVWNMVNEGLIDFTPAPAAASA